MHGNAECGQAAGIVKNYTYLLTLKTNEFWFIATVFVDEVNTGARETSKHDSLFRNV